MKKSARVSEKLVSPGLPGLQVAMRLCTEAAACKQQLDNLLDKLKYCLFLAIALYI